jgi:hypothetical protein
MMGKTPMNENCSAVLQIAEQISNLFYIGEHCV